MEKSTESVLIQIKLKIPFQYGKTGNKSNTLHTEIFKFGAMPFSDQGYSRLVTLHHMNQRIYLWSLSV